MDARNQLSPYVLAALLAGIAASSCSKVNDMHDATMQMAATTQHMAASTDKLGDNTVDLKSETDELKTLMGQILDTGRQGASVDLRRNFMNEITKATQPDAKAKNACVYFQSFEYQLWSGVGLDTYKAERLRLTQDAVQEFFGTVAGIAHWDASDVDPFAGVMPKELKNISDQSLLAGIIKNIQQYLEKPFVPSDLENEEESFNALAVTLEKVNRQEALAPSSPTDEQSMLGLIESALTAGQKIKAGKARIEDYPAYVDLVLQNEELATRLLRARAQMAATAPLCKLTTLCQDLKEGAKYLIEKQAWELDFSELSESKVKTYSDLNVSELRYVSFYLSESIKARDFLAGLGIETKLDGRILQVYAQKKILNAPSAAQAAAGDESAQVALTVLKQIHDLTGQ